MQFKFKTLAGNTVVLELAALASHTYRINNADGTIALKYPDVPEFTVAKMPRNSSQRRKKVAEFIIHVDDWTDEDHTVPADTVFAPQMPRFASNIMEAFQFNFDVEITDAPKGTIDGIRENSRVVTFLVSSKGAVNKQYLSFLAKLKTLTFADFGKLMPENKVDHQERGVICTYFPNAHSFLRKSFYA